MSLVYRTRFAVDHRWAPVHMSEYLDGELAGIWRARIERHLRDCSECTRLLGDLRRIVNGLHHLPNRLDSDFDADRTAATVRARLDLPPAPD